MRTSEPHVGERTETREYVGGFLCALHKPYRERKTKGISARQ